MAMLICLSATALKGQSVQCRPIDRDEFYSNVLTPDNKKPVILLFGANYCPYSRQMINIVKELSTSYGEYAYFFTVNIEHGDNSNWLIDMISETDCEILGVPFSFFLCHDGYIYSWIGGPVSGYDFETEVIDLLDLEYEE